MSKPDDPMHHALRLVQAACQLAGPFAFVDEGRASLSRQGVIGALRRHDTPALFDWLMTVLSFQGIADRVAEQYLKSHGNVTWANIDRALKRKPSCTKLGGYWLFHDCRYEKGSGLCSEPGHMARCPLPQHVLRNGRLNQTAYSLFLFVRDVAGGDLVQWIDDQVSIRKFARTFQVPQAASLGAPSLESDPADADWTTELQTGSEDTSMAFGKRQLFPSPLAKRIKISQQLLRALLRCRGTTAERRGGFQCPGTLHRTMAGLIRSAWAR